MLTSRLSTIALIGALVAAGIVVLAGPLHRFGVPFGTVFSAMQIAAIAAAAFAILGIIALILAFARKRPKTAAIAAILIGGAGFLAPASMAAQAGNLPFIHDITTDTDDPPAFVDVVPLRADAPNPAAYDPAVAEQQKAGYPDIVPLHLDMPPEEAFARALAAVEESGWELHAAERDEGRIEATATTAWFGFKDDVVVRVRPESGGSVVDVRSKSRIGQSDLGKNAARIRDLLTRIETG
ncbi:hypothetical protein B5C34_00970 [Pacificimonas flava]|uniref:DUF1499 domain-containing protein n=2 Tax=Pacificimonas TaxID=1960290 RepID=A0A219B2W3_9SPHN|nr:MULTISPECIES: DUF1499 domain-containing protein [Pacificimonas]MBZ6378215.1 DUF1499 domain-containing protein [Pacificimonas aurantium]OWV32159.1 hypothetical protein B5C34_00970 [Pacificimonas flava]